MAKKTVLDTPEWVNNVRQWSRDAAEERDLLRYFYQRDLMAGLMNGHLSVVTGRKGTGKTAIVEYIQETACSLRNHHVAAFNLENFGVFGEPPPTAAESALPDLYPHWLLVLLTELAKLMLESGQISPAVKTELTKALATSPSLLLQGYKLVTTKVGANVGVAGYGIGGEHEQHVLYSNMDIAAKARQFKEYLASHIDSSFYYIIIDGIDSNFTPVANAKSTKYFYNYVNGLIRAVLDIRRTFSNTHAKVFPIATVRSDIYDEIDDADANKRSSRVHDLTWTEDDLKSLIDFRVARLADADCKTPDSIGAFEGLFANKTINKQKIYKFATAWSFLRPRDVVNFVKEAVRQSTSFPIPNTDLRKIELSQSRYLEAEIRDECHNEFPDFQSFIDCLAQIGNGEINRAHIKDVFVSNNNTSYQEALDLAYKYNILGIKSARSNIFHYVDRHARLLPRHQLVLHPGLRASVYYDAE